MSKNTELTEQSFAVRLKPLTLLPNAPALDAELLAFLVAVFRDEHVSPDDLSEGVVEVVKTATFWPAPAELLKASAEARDRRLAPDRIRCGRLIDWLARRRGEQTGPAREIRALPEFAEWALSDESSADDDLTKAAREYLDLMEKLRPTGRYWVNEADRIAARERRMKREGRLVTG